MTVTAHIKQESKAKQGLILFYTTPQALNFNLGLIVFKYRNGMCVCVSRLYTLFSLETHADEKFYSV